MYRVLVNGVETSHIDVSDRGFQYGDGLFETIAVRDGRPLLWRRHITRLRRGCDYLGIDAPDAAGLESEARGLCDGLARAVLKIIVTRGVGGRGYKPSGCGPATRVLAVHAWPQYPPRAGTEGVALRVCGTRLATGGVLAGLKHLNRLEQVLARGEWDAPDIAEGLMLDEADHVIEGTMSNVFIARGGTLFTPDVSRAGVAGVVRGLILDNAERTGVTCVIKPVQLQELPQADEVFICNSLTGVWPVKSIEQWQYTPGPLARRFAELVGAAEMTED
jgi:4-amino-4-deoxychorismate lyase